MNHEGFLDQLLRVIHDFDKNVYNEKYFRQIIKTRLEIGSYRNKSTFLVELRTAHEYLSDIMSVSINNLIMEENSDTKNIIEKMYTPLAISKIFRCTKGNIHHWITRGDISKYTQTVKGGKIMIPSSAIDEFVEENPKYKNFWVNNDK